MTADNFSIYSDRELAVWQSKAKSSLETDEAQFLDKWLPNNPELHILEGGTGSGRISFNLAEKGYKHITAYDFVPDMIKTAHAVAAERHSQISFHVGDATTADNWLPNAQHSFDYALYMQQLLSLIPLNDWPQTLSSVRAMLKPGGFLLATFVHDSGRRRNQLLRPAMNLIRRSRGQTEHPYSLPWLKLGGQPNYRFWQRDQALVNWLPKDDIISQIEDSGLVVTHVTTSAQLNGTNGDGKNSNRGYLFVVCQN